MENIALITTLLSTTDYERLKVAARLILDNEIKDATVAHLITIALDKNYPRHAFLGAGFNPFQTQNSEQTIASQTHTKNVQTYCRLAILMYEHFCTKELHNLISKIMQKLSLDTFIPESVKSSLLDMLFSANRTKIVAKCSKLEEKLETLEADRTKIIAKCSKLEEKLETLEAELEAEKQTHSKTVEKCNILSADISKFNDTAITFKNERKRRHIGE